MLDLDVTIFDDFVDKSSSIQIQAARVRAFQVTEAPLSVRLVSFARWDACQIAQLQRWLTQDLNQLLTLEMLFGLCQKYGTVLDTTAELLLFFERDFGFRDFIMSSLDSQSRVLSNNGHAACSMTFHISRRPPAVQLAKAFDLL